MSLIVRHIKGLSDNKKMCKDEAYIENLSSLTQDPLDICHFSYSRTWIYRIWSPFGKTTLKHIDHHRINKF